MPKGDAAIKRAMRTALVTTGVLTAVQDPAMQPLLSFGFMKTCDDVVVNELPSEDSEEYEAFARHLCEWVLARPSVVGEAVKVISSQYQDTKLLCQHRGRIPNYAQSGYQAVLNAKAAWAPYVPLALALLNENILVHAVRVYPKGTIQACVDYGQKCQHVEELWPGFLKVATICMDQGPAMAGHFTRSWIPDVQRMAIDKMKDPEILKEMAAKGVWDGGKQGMSQNPIATYMEYTAGGFVEHRHLHPAIKKSFEGREHDEKRFLGYVQSRKRFYVETRDPLVWHVLFEKIFDRHVPEDFVPPAQDMQRAIDAVQHYLSIE